MCAKASKSYDYDLTNIAKSNPKMTKNQPVLNFLQTSQILSLSFEQNFLQSFYMILLSLKCNGTKNVCLSSDTQQKVAPKWPKNHFWTFSIFSNTIFTIRATTYDSYAIVLFFSRLFHENFKLLKNCPYDFSRIFAQSFYTQRDPCVGKGIKIVWLECEKHCQT